MEGREVWWQGEEPLTLGSRVQLISFTSKYQASSLPEKTGTNSNLSSIAIAANVVSDVVSAVLTDREGFEAFLLALEKRKPRPISIGGFERFYKRFYEAFQTSGFHRLKAVIELYARQKWYKPLTRRNTLFSNSAIGNQPWLPVRQALAEYKLYKSSLEDGIAQGYLTVRLERKSRRTYRLINRRDLEKWVASRRDLINALEARVILGVTKRQFQELLQSGLLGAVKEPGPGKPWQLPRSAMEGFLNRHVGSASTAGTSGNLVAIPGALRIICGRLERPLVQLLTAISDGTITAHCSGADSTGLRKICVDRQVLAAWIEAKRQSGSLSADVGLK